MQVLIFEQRSNDGKDGEPLADATNEAAQTNGVAKSPKEAPVPRQRGPPEDGIPSTTKVMVANLPYEMSEEKVRYSVYFIHRDAYSATA